MGPVILAVEDISHQQTLYLLPLELELGHISILGQVT